MKAKLLFVLLLVVCGLCFPPLLPAQSSTNPIGNRRSPYGSNTASNNNSATSFSASGSKKQYIPFDSGLGLLIGIGMAYGFKRAYDKRKSTT